MMEEIDGQIPIDGLGIGGVSPEDITRLTLVEQIEIKKRELEDLMTEQYRQGTVRRLSTRWTMVNRGWVARLVDK